MKFIDNFVRTLEGALQKSRINKSPQDVDFVRQNSPPDERDADIAEAGGDSEIMPGLSGAAEQESGRANNWQARAKNAGRGS